MKRKIAVLATLVMIMSLFTLPVSAETDLAELVLVPEILTYPLYAGQDMLVGDVLVKQDENGICVKFVLNDDAVNDGWLITETHVAVADDEAQIPQKNGNPIPGQFSQKETFDPGMPGSEWYCLDTEPEWTAPYAVAAHAVVEKQECIVNAIAPYEPSVVHDYLQGSQLDLGAIKFARSNPDAALEYEGTKNEANFYSLGFIIDGDDNYDDGDEAFLTVMFDVPVLNGPGNDIQIVEDTWGLPYPVESCDVYASMDGNVWEYLGEADNQTPMDAVHTVTEFDLGSLPSASYIKLVDTTPSGPFLVKNMLTADGFDVNAIIALQDNVECITYSETAWGGMEDFSGKNWARYISFTPVILD